MYVIGFQVTFTLRRNQFKVVIAKASGMWGKEEVAHVPNIYYP